MSATIRFGTDGWRGIIGEDFNEANVRAVTGAIVRALEGDGVPRPRLVVGHDCRTDGELFARAVAQEVVSGGGLALVAHGYTPTPALSWATVDEGADGAIVVTASHNPPRYSGLKFKARHGGSAAPGLTARFEAELERGDAPEGALGDSGTATATVAGTAAGTREVENLQKRYGDAIVRLAGLSAGSLSRLSVVVDPLYGAGRGWLAPLLESCGASVTEIHGGEDPSFGGLLPEPIPPHTDGLARAVSQAHAHVGIALDGDADRLGAVDATGRFVNSHEIFALLLADQVERHGERGRVVKTVSTSDRIARMAAHFDLELTETPIGFKYICEEMLVGDVLIGGEESGGIGIAAHLPERDGMLCSLLLLRAMAESGRTLDELLADLDRRFGPSSYDRIDVHLEHDAKQRLLERLPGFRPAELRLGDDTGDSGHGGRLPVIEIVDLDWMKYRVPDGWVMIRPSGTEDLVRLYAEADGPSRVAGLLEWAKDTVRRLASA